MSRAARPAGAAPRWQSSSHSAGASLGREQQLDAVLAGVAGAAHQHLGAGKTTRGRCHARRQGRVGDGLHDLARTRALDGEHRVVIHTVVQPGVEIAGVRAKPGEVALVV